MSEMATIFGRQSSTMSKVTKNKWTVKDSPGELRNINKHVLQVHPAYQRSCTNSKVTAIAAAWSWIACSTIIVGHRGGDYWVIDGQHRVLAARKRADITDLPCVVFETDGISQEAKGFLDANTMRKAVNSIDKFHAAIAAGDETAVFVSNLFEELEIMPSQYAKTGKQIKSVGFVMAKAIENRADIEVVIRFTAKLCENHPISERILSALTYIYQSGLDIREPRLSARIMKIGPAGLLKAANKAAAYFAAGGAKVWATGVIDEVNKGLRTKYEIGANDESND